MAQKSLTASVAASPRRRRLEVLLADDERDTVLTLAALLESEGHSVQGVYKGSDVLAALRFRVPDVCIFDIDLPGGPSGFALAREIRAIYGEKAPLLIAISGKFTGQTDKMLAELAGFDHYCLKPCEPQQLLELIAQASPSTSPNEYQDPTYARVLRLASRLIGGIDALCNHLGVSRVDLCSWQTGKGRPPAEVFLRAVDVLLVEHAATGVSAVETTIHPLPQASGVGSPEAS